MEGCQEYEQEIDLKDLLFHVLYRWRSVILAALIVGILAAGYAFGYNAAVLPGKRTVVQDKLEEQLRLREALIAQEQGQGQEQTGDMLKVQEQGLTAEQINQQIQELGEQLDGLKELSPAKNFAMGFAAGFFGMIFCYGAGYVFSDKLRGERELRERYGYCILGVFPRAERKRFLSGIDRLLERIEGTEGHPSEEEIYRIISVKMTNLAGNGGTFLVTGTVSKERLQEFVGLVVQHLREDMTLVPGSDMNVTADTLEVLAECDGVVLLEERGRSLRRQIHKEHESIASFGKQVVGYVVL